MSKIDSEWIAEWIATIRRWLTSYQDQIDWHKSMIVSLEESKTEAEGWLKEAIEKQQEFESIDPGPKDDQ